MATLFILIFLIISLLLMVFRSKKTSVIWLFLTLICYLLVGQGWIPSFLLSRLQSDYSSLPAPSWKNHNTIVLLGAGTVMLPATQNVQPSVMAYPRIEKAAELYFSCI